MGRLWNKWLVPALFAVILFLCIREIGRAHV